MKTRKIICNDLNTIVDDFGLFIPYKYYIRIKGSNISEYNSSHILCKSINKHHIEIKPEMKKDDKFRVYIKFQLKTDTIKRELKNKHRKNEKKNL